MRKPSEVMSALQENESRYAAEVETGSYASGKPLPPKLLERRRESLARVRERIAILARWMKSPPSPHAAMTSAEREFIVEWGIDPDYLFAASGR